MFTAYYCEFVIVCELEAICVSVFSWLCLMLFSFVSPAQKKDMRDRSYTSAFYISQLLPHRSSTLTGQILTTDTIIYMHRYFIYLRFVTLCIIFASSRSLSSNDTVLAGCSSSISLCTFPIFKHNKTLFMVPIQFCKIRTLHLSKRKIWSI
jgi:hypothetical protein